LANYYRSDLAFIYYDPAIEINRLAESQKWTDCWATGTAFVSNSEVVTLKPYIVRGACFHLRYDDDEGLAGLITSLILSRAEVQRNRAALARMDFRYWDEEMQSVIREWIDISDACSRQ
jgi:hypothetical protein